MVVQAAGQDPGGVGDLADGRGAVTLLREKLAASATMSARRPERMVPSGSAPTAPSRPLAWLFLVVPTFPLSQVRLASLALVRGGTRRALLSRMKPVLLCPRRPRSCAAGPAEAGS